MQKIEIYKGKIMWQDKLKEIIYILENSNVIEIEVTFLGRKYRVNKSSSFIRSEEESNIVSTAILESESKGNLSRESSEQNESKSNNKLMAPMPGTFYTGPSPDDPPFVSVGDHVKTGQVVCIIEAMKIMNEIEAECDGIIQNILVNNSDPVEYNQPLFVIDPS